MRIFKALTWAPELENLDRKTQSVDVSESFRRPLWVTTSPNQDAAFWKKRRVLLNPSVSCSFLPCLACRMAGAVVGFEECRAYEQGMRASCCGCGVVTQRSSRRFNKADNAKAGMVLCVGASLCE